MRRVLAGAAILTLLFACSFLATRTHGGPFFWAATVTLVAVLCISSNRSSRRVRCDDPFEAALRGLLRGLFCAVSLMLIISLLVQFALEEMGGKSLLYVLFVSPVAIVVGSVSGAVSRFIHHRRVSQTPVAAVTPPMGALMKRRRLIYFLSAYVLAGVVFQQFVGFISGLVAHETSARILKVRRPEEGSSFLAVQFGASKRPYDLYRFEDPHFKSQRNPLYTIVIVPHDKSRPALMYSPLDDTSKILFSESGQDELRECLSREGYPVWDFNWGIYGPLGLYIQSEEVDHSTDGFVWHGRDPIEMRQRSMNFTPEATIHYRPGTNYALVALVEDNVRRVRRMTIRSWLRGESSWDVGDEREAIDCRLGDPLTPLHRILLRLSYGCGVILDILVMPLQPVFLLLFMSVPWGGT